MYLSGQPRPITTTDKDRLIKAAFTAKENAYSRHSNFRVGAALLCTNSAIIRGSSIDCASYGGTVCAERTAIVKAVSEGIRSFLAIAIVSDISTPISPCGLCREVLREFCTKDMTVLLVPSDYEKRLAEGSQGGGVHETIFGELLPSQFL